MTNISLVHEGVRYFDMAPATLLEKGVPQAVIDAEILNVKVAEISSECRRRIYTVASAETQMNMAAASALISSKTASARTEQEKAVLAGLEAAIEWVGAMRANVATLASDPSKDFTADEHWPEAPAAAAVVADQF
jgi:hypothetical protein